MSHFTEIKTQIKDIEALRSACHELGLTLLQHTEASGYYENKTKGDYVVQLKGPYDIALNKQEDGTFGLTADLWQGRVEKEVGQGYGKLLQLYGVHKATIEARKKGLSVLRWYESDSGEAEVFVAEPKRLRPLVMVGYSGNLANQRPCSLTALQHAVWQPR